MALVARMTLASTMAAPGIEPWSRGKEPENAYLWAATLGPFFQKYGILGVKLHEPNWYKSFDKNIFVCISEAYHITFSTLYITQCFSRLLLLIT